MQVLHMTRDAGRNAWTAHSRGLTQGDRDDPGQVSGAWTASWTGTLGNPRVVCAFIACRLRCRCWPSACSDERASYNPPVLTHVVGHQSPAFASNPERGIDKSTADCSRKASAADPG